jgi:hypothetical protein
MTCQSLVSCLHGLVSSDRNSHMVSYAIVVDGEIHKMDNNSDFAHLYDYIRSADQHKTPVQK